MAWLAPALWLGACNQDSGEVSAHALGTHPPGPGTGQAERPAALEQVHAAGVVGRDSPTAGEDAALVYDAARRRLLLYGGKGDDDKNLNELWSFELASRKWLRILSEGPQPPPREDHTVVLDTANDQLVLFGGEDGDTSKETWTFDLQELRWHDITVDSAPAVESHVSIYDPKAHRMIVFGGMCVRQDKMGIAKETWTLDLEKGSPSFGSWSELPVKGPQPGARREHEGVYDPVRHRMLVFGGRQRSNASFLNDVWALDLASCTWSEIETRGERPNPIRQMAIGYDPVANELTVFGGEVLAFMAGRDKDKRELLVNHLWVLGLDSGLWVDRTPYPPSMYDHAGLFVPEYGGTLIYGGSSCRPNKEHSTWLILGRDQRPAPGSNAPR